MRNEIRHLRRLERLVLALGGGAAQRAAVAVLALAVLSRLPAAHFRGSGSEVIFMTGELALTTATSHSVMRSIGTLA